MQGWTSRARQVGIVLLLFLIPSVLAGAGLRPAAPLLAAAATPEDAGDDLVEPNGLIGSRTKPAPAQGPQLIVAELSPRKAPVPSGPVTYVPILYYHYIRINPNPRDRLGFSLSTPPAMFRAQMQYLADPGFHVTSLHEAGGAGRNPAGLPSRPTGRTFYVGYASFFTGAAPMLPKTGVTA